MADVIKKPVIRFQGFADDWEQRKLDGILEERINKTSDFESNPLYSLTIENGVTPKTERYERDFLVQKQEDLFKIVNPNEFVTNPMNLRFGALGYNKNTFSVSVSGYYDVFSIDNNECSPFWNSYFKTPESLKYFDNVATGSLIEKRRVKYSTLRGMVFYMPRSLDEKKKIAAFFDNLDNLISLHQRKYEKFVNLKKSMLEKMFPRKGCLVPEIRFKGFTGDWEERKVSDVSDRYDNLRVPVAANLRVKGATPYYGANGIQDYVEGYTHDGEFILVAEDGANDLKNYPVNYVKGRVWVNNHAHVLQAKSHIADNRFLGYAVSRANIESVLVGGGRAKLNAEVLMDLDLNIPEIDEQIKISSFISSFDTLITLYRSKLEGLKNIKKSMLEKMFV